MERSKHLYMIDETTNEMINSDLFTRRFPFCIVWTPIPILSWIFPIIGHLGIATSKGIIRDFAGSYFVSEDEMAFGLPIRYWQLDPKYVCGGAEAWDRAVKEASDEYKGHIHNLFCNNCHSHVALALNKMKYAGKKNYNMVNLAISMIFKGHYTGFGGFVKHWLPSFIILIFLFSIFIVSSF